MSQLCPRCQESAKCVDTRQVDFGRVKRRFECANCKCRFYSDEVITRIGSIDLAAPKNYIQDLSEILLARLTAQGYQITKVKRDN